MIFHHKRFNTLLYPYYHSLYYNNLKNVNMIRNNLNSQQNWHCIAYKMEGHSFNNQLIKTLNCNSICYDVEHWSYNQFGKKGTVKSSKSNASLFQCSDFLFQSNLCFPHLHHTLYSHRKEAVSFIRCVKTYAAVEDQLKRGCDLQNTTDLFFQAFG